MRKNIRSSRMRTDFSIFYKIAPPGLMQTWHGLERPDTYVDVEWVSQKFIERYWDLQGLGFAGIPLLTRLTYRRGSSFLLIPPPTNLSFHYANSLPSANHLKRQFILQLASNGKSNEGTYSFAEWIFIIPKPFYFFKPNQQIVFQWFNLYLIF